MSPTTELSPNQIVTGKVRLSYVHVFEPYAQQANQDAKYSCVLLIPKSDRATLDKINRAIEHAKENGKAKFGGRVPANLTTTLHDGDEEADLERNPEYAGHMYMSVSSKTKPGLVDRNREPIIDANDVYSGCYARVQIGAFAYNNSGNKGISFGLNHIQKLGDGEPLGGMMRAEDVFDPIPDDEYEDEASSLI